jgi:GrpB-like predicted nucleotidyltransferase (UPF0157 family)
VETREERIRRLAGERVEIVSHDPAWAESFRRERDHLLACLPPGLVRRIEHFGSTAVPGLAAKPIVDVLVEVGDLEAARTRVAPLLEAQGYEFLWRPVHGADGPPYYAWFIRRDPRTGARTHHVHMVDASFTGYWDGLVFRDHLIAHPDDARAYETLKRRLAAEAPDDRVRYARGKREYIERVIAGAKRGSGGGEG